ncbi:unnamed protein product, partial [Owenia fusiformis]
CEPHDDCEGHYTCADDGSKICLANWTDNGCKTWVGEPYECVLNKGYKIYNDLRGMWDGSVECTGKIPLSYTLNITVTSDITTPSGIFELSYNASDGVHYTAKGTYEQNG